MICGIDLSISSPAITVFDGQFTCYFRDKIATDQTSNAIRFRGSEEDRLYHIRRYNQIADWIEECILKHFPANNKLFVVFEGISYGSPGRIVQLAENAGVIKARLAHSYYVDIIDVAPTTVKKFATGAGFCEKIDMVRKFEEETGVDFSMLFPGKNIEKSPISDIVDSYWICRYAINNKEELVNSLDSNGCQTKPKKRKKRKAKPISI